MRTTPGYWCWNCLTRNNRGTSKCRTSGWVTRGLAFSPTTHWVAVAPIGEQVELFDWHSGNRVMGIGGRRNAGFQNVAFTPDGQRLALGSGQMISLWDLRSKRELLNLYLGRDFGADRFLFSPGGDRLVATAGDVCEVFCAPLYAQTQSAPALH